MSGLHVVPLSTKDPSPPIEGSSPAHWVGSPPATFRNPWPSFAKENGFWDALQTRFGSNRNFVPVPATRDELVKVRSPKWGRGQANWESNLKATWLGHAGVLVELASPLEGRANTDGSHELDKSESRGLKIGRAHV